VRVIATDEELTIARHLRAVITPEASSIPSL
jgi:hypothetical protein